MSVEGTTVKLKDGACLFAEAMHMYIWEFGQLSFLAVLSVQVLLTSPLFEQQPGDGFPALLSIISVVSDRNYTYPIS